MNVYIPIVGIGYFLLAYMAIGAILYLPLVLWTNRFLSNRPTGLGRVRIGKELLASVVAWPIILFTCVKTEIAYRKKGYL